MDQVERSKKLQHVIEQVNSYPGEKRQMGDSTFISCPYHAEKTPSARVFHSTDSKSPGYLKCYGCGASKPFDTWAKDVGLQPYKRGKPEDSYSLLSLSSVSNLVELDEDSLKKEKFKFKKLKPDDKWRSIKTNLLIDIGAKLCKVWSDDYQKWGSYQIYLPCDVRGRLVGYIKARIEKHEKYPSYINASGPWSKTHGLFPFDYAIALMKKKRSATMLLVEGPRDALRLLQMGIPAMCILGTQSFSPNKAKLLELSGVTKIVLFMDGDAAGIDATKKIKPVLDPMLDVKTLKLWSMKGSPWLKVQDAKNPKKKAAKLGLSMWDPGSCPKELLKRVKDKYYG